MTRVATPKLGAYAALAALGMIAAVALGRPELAVLAAPFALVLGAGLATARAPELDVAVGISRERALEGETVELELVVASRSTIDRLELQVRLPRRLALARGETPIALRLRAGEHRTLTYGIECSRWGGYVLGEILVRARDRTGVLEFERQWEAASPLRVYPLPHELPSLVAPAETRPFVGNQVSRAKGAGIEFADLRLFAPGDRPREINWRASARRGELVVNERHPERNTDVVVFLDSFVDVRGDGRGTLDLAVGAAASLVERYLDRRDRVGLVSFGGVLQWLVAASGTVQRYRILDALIGTEVTLSYAWKDIDVLPPRTLPPKALVLALTPLVDERSVGVLLDLRARGFDVAVIEVSPLPFVGPGNDRGDELAYRLWLLRREALRRHFLRAGVAVSEWRYDGVLAGAVEEVGAFRRRAVGMRG